MGMDQGRGGGVADQDNPDPDLSHRKKPEPDSTLEKKTWIHSPGLCAGFLNTRSV